MMSDKTKKVISPLRWAFWEGRTFRGQKRWALRRPSHPASPRRNSRDKALLLLCAQFDPWTLLHPDETSSSFDVYFQSMWPIYTKQNSLRKSKLKEKREAPRARKLFAPMMRPMQRSLHSIQRRRISHPKYSPNRTHSRTSESDVHIHEFMFKST